MMSESNKIVVNYAIHNAIALNNMSLNDADAASPSSAQVVENELAAAMKKLKYCDEVLDCSWDLPRMPTELIGHIGSYLEKKDLDNFRLVSKRFDHAVYIQYGKIMVAQCTIFPTFSSVEHFLALFRKHPVWAGLVQSVTLVGDGLREHEHGSEWALERLTDAERVHPTPNDWAIIDSVMHEFEEYIDQHGGFCYSGDYRSMLEELFARLPKLKDIICRKLYPGEHLPGWNGPKLLKGLSFYRPDLNTNAIFYGDWRYDTVHNRVTKWTDEFGEEVEEDDAGPQAQFIDDVLAARDLGSEADIFY